MTLSTWLSALLLTSLFSYPSASAATLTVAAAADLIQLERPLADAFHTQSGATLRFSFGASGILAQQIENGAPFDVFLAANEKYVKDLAARGAVDAASVRIYAVGRLGLWSPDARYRTLAQLLDPALGTLAIANPDFAPYGLAARQLLEHQGLWKKLEPKIVYGENVTQALQFAESGNAGAAITSWTLVASRGGILLPADHDPIRQAAAVVKASKNSALAARFLDFLTTGAGRGILSSHGLTPP
jgi:molybdate transport system substrate-binding protein